MANATHSKTELSELGEFGLIRRLTENIVLKNDSTLKGVGDDCAVLDFKNQTVPKAYGLILLKAAQSQIQNEQGTSQTKNK